MKRVAVSCAVSVGTFALVECAIAAPPSSVRFWIVAFTAVMLGLVVAGLLGPRDQVAEEPENVWQKVCDLCGHVERVSGDQRRAIAHAFRFGERIPCGGCGDVSSIARPRHHFEAAS